MTHHRFLRPLALAIGATVTALVLSSCAPGGGAAPAASSSTTISAKVTPAQVAKLGSTTLSVWADQAEQPLMKNFIPAFEKKYPNVKVDITYKSFDDLVATVVNAAASANAPDVFEGNIGYAVDGALVKAKLVRPLDDVAKVYGWTSGTGASTLAPARWDAAGTTFGSGTLYGMSPISEVQGIYYNKSKLQSLGLQPPTTIAALEKDAAAAEAAGEVPMMLGNSDQYAATHIFSDIAVTTQKPASIRDWIGGKAGTTFQTSGNEKAADTLKSWVSKGYFEAGYDGLSNEDAIAKFAKGTGVFFVGGSWNGASLDSTGFGFGSLVSGGVGATASPWHISSKSKKTDAGIAWLDMLHSPQTGQWILDGGRLPVITDGVKASDSLSEETLTALKETIAAGTQVGYYDWSTTDMLSVMGGSLQEVMAGRISSADFTKTVQAAWAKGHK
ncbi:extracellular solute-binding protein [Leifsonia shinshuensis]|uniref:ABC transporter substrate-binding protein n=1 Tax=Leifsonia shinshuensis TaxID=150026 RepID=UPI00285C3903|nr:extracellular solute-binding protein [Leifsonia shinshuensis]MDR6972784.1 raffinose/stachyose/melibiose transport system substrate-binding protein [Leifsonia shinshuensis]